MISFIHALEKTVVVVAGMHWDSLSEESIAGILESCGRLVDVLLTRIGR